MIAPPNASNSNANGPGTAGRHRYRIRFAKVGDLRLTGHRDLIRLFERMLRRADLRLAMTEGFHPKPRMTFPSALALGVAGLDEVMELELANPRTADELKELLSRHAPPGLEILSVQLMPPGTKKAQVRFVWFEVVVPDARQEEVAANVRTLLDAERWHVRRAGRERPVDIRSYIEEMHLGDGKLTAKVAVTPAGTVRPRELIDALTSAAGDELAAALTRTKVELER